MLRCWDKAVRDMRPEEYAVLECPSSMAYGSAGSTSVPPDTPIITDIYVLGCRNRDRKTIASYLMAFLKWCTSWYILVPALIIGGILFSVGDFLLLYYGPQWDMSSLPPFISYYVTMVIDFQYDFIEGFVDLEWLALRIDDFRNNYGVPINSLERTILKKLGLR